MSTDWRALCAELIEAVLADDSRLDILDIARRARAALAEPVAEGVTDEELLELTEDWPATTGPRHDLSGCPEVPLYSVFADEVVEFARAVLARYGHQPAPPADGEVGELVRWLRGANWDGKRQSLATRAADLLEQRHPAPVPVAERLQQLEDLAADAVSGLRYIEQTHGRLYGVGWDRVYEKADRLQPGHALPLPAGEVEP